MPVLIRPLIQYPLRHRLPTLLLWYRQPPTLARQTRRHERRPAEHKSDSATIYTDSRKRLGKAVDEAQMRYGDAIVLLEEDGLAVDNVEADAVGKLDLL